jgi:catechol 2,3-dioxygenase-like lactoylglutathione lyase family enzyme
MRVYETVLYGEPAVLGRFYADVFGLRAVSGPDELAATFRLDDGGMLLIFDAARSSVPGRPVPSHGTSGAAHVAFAVEAGELDEWRERLTRAGIAIEQEVDWDGRGRSIYIRDPAGNAIELVEGDIWPP